jgi:uncharacterized protein
MILPCLSIQETLSMGRGVFTSQDLPAATIIEISPVIVLNHHHKLLLDKTLLHDYIFHWGETESECCMALGYLSLYNHNYHSNAEYEMNFEARTMLIKTVRDIRKGREIYINYNGNWDDQKPVWFDLPNGFK